MTFKQSSTSESGSSLVMVLAATAITGVMIAAISTMLLNSQKDTKALAQKLEILQTQVELSASLADTAVCGCNFDPTKNTSNGSALTFNSNNPSNASVNMSKLFSACIGNAPANPILTSNQPLPGTMSNLKAQNISLTQIQSTGTPGSYTGQLQVQFDPTSLVISRHPASVTMNFQADTSNPAAAKITSCSTAGAVTGSGSGGAGAPGTMTNCELSSTASCPSGKVAKQCMAIGMNSYSCGGSLCSRITVGAGTLTTSRGTTSCSGSGGSGAFTSPGYLYNCCDP